MPVSIRNVLSADAMVISHLSAELGYNMSPEKTLSQINAINTSTDNVAYVALLDNVIVAWIHIFYTVRLESDSYCEIGGLVVSSVHRGKGIGKALIAHSKQWCIAKKVSTLRVRSNVTRTEAHTFYINAGFQQIKRQEVFAIQL